MLDKKDYKNLGVFLSRVELKGNEAPVFVELCAKLKAMEEQDGKDTRGKA